MFELLPTPHNLDHITGLQFSPHTQNLVVTSFDSKVLLYDCSGPVIQSQELDTPTVPLSLLTTPHGSYIGGLDGSVRLIDYENRRADPILPPGEQENHLIGVNQLCTLGLNIVASNFAGDFTLIDPRQRVAATSSHAGGKIFHMDASSKYLTLGLTGNLIELYDERNLKQPFESRDLGLQLQIMDLKCFSLGFALSTVDGRVLMEYYDLATQAEKRFTFKCHRYSDKETGVDQVFPVNKIGFSKKNEDFLYTGGSDGLLCLWDCSKRKRTKVFPKFLGGEPKQPESVMALDVNDGDEMIAVGTSDDGYRRVRRLSEGGERIPSKVYLRRSDVEEDQD